jgi:dTDP-4-amino-4,6-dideoxygalactose transaminase
VCRPQLPIGAKLLPYLARIDQSRVYSNHGHLVLELEARIAQFLGLPNGACVSASSGTVAIVGAILAAAGRATPDRPFAIVPSYTHTATAVAVELCGYQPYLIDIDPETWMLDPNRIEAITDIDRVGLIVPVAPFGRPVRQADWSAVRERTRIPIVIDGAASFDLLATSPGDFLGSVPVAVSFHATKCFSSGEGGGVFTTDVALATRTVQTMNFGFHDSRESKTASINGKMSEYHAAVGLAELAGWPEKLADLLAVAAAYRGSAESAEISNQIVTSPDISSCYVLFRSADPEQADAVCDALSNAGVDYRYWFGTGLHGQLHFERCPRDPDLSVTEHIAATVIGLPVAPDLTEAVVSRIVSGLLVGIQAST